MRLILSGIFLLSFLNGQDCLIDGKKMSSVGPSEIINGEKLSLFCCDDGHQMWLAKYDVFNEPIKKDKVESNIEIDKTIKNNAKRDLTSLKLKESELKHTSNHIITSKSSSSENKTVKKSAKIEMKNVNVSNSINIAKYGVETLLHKKLESDRLFNESIEDEKYELLSLMNTQKSLFDRFDMIKPEFKYFKVSLYSVAILLLASLL